jgi:hypothetical protein
MLVVGAAAFVSHTEAIKIRSWCGADRFPDEVGYRPVGYGSGMLCGE